MKKIILTILLGLLYPNVVLSWTAYKYDNGVFALYPDSLWSNKDLPLVGSPGFKPGAIGYIPAKLGYLDDEWYVWTNENIDAVVFKAFTQTPICVLINAENKSNQLNEKEYEKLISDFNYNNEFNVERAVRGKIRQTFMEEALHQTATDNCIVDDTSQFKYVFKDGYLINAESLDGLVGLARRFKGTDIFRIIQKNALDKHNDTILALKEVNFQFYCLERMAPEHFRLAYNDVYDYNIALVWFSLYGVANKAKLSEFMMCVPDAKPLDISTGSVTLGWGSNIFVFENDILIAVK